MTTTPTLAPLPVVLNGQTMLEALFSRAAPSMSADELAELAAQSVDLARGIAQRSAEVAEGIAALVTQDDVRPGCAGNFQGGHDLPGLLLHLGDSLQQVAGLASLASKAGALAQGRRA